MDGYPGRTIPVPAPTSVTAPTPTVAPTPTAAPTPASAPPPVPVAAPAPLAPLLLGPPRDVRVAALTSCAAYLATGDPAVPAVCLATRDAVRLPYTVVLAAAPGDRPFAGWRVGQPGVVGDGGLSIGGRVLRVARWWRPGHPRGLGSAPASVLRAAAATLARQPDPLDAAGRTAVRHLVVALAGGADPSPAVRRLLGRGPGLTPLGDDVLAAAMVTLRALAAPAASPLAAAVTAAAPTRTTFVSVAMLAAAARGECVAALTGLLGAVGRAAPGPDLAAATAAVGAIGHTSGSGLVQGVLAGLAAAGHAPSGVG